MSAPMFDAGIERALTAWILADPARLARAFEYGLTVRDLGDPQAYRAVEAAANVAARGEAVTLEAVREQLQADHDRKGPHPAGEERPDLTWLDRIVRHPLSDGSPIGGWCASVRRFAERREQASPRRTYHRVPDVVDEIIARAADTWASLTLGGEELFSMRAGAIAVPMGPTGSGKTSLVAALAIEHARDRGPVVLMSRELPRDEFVARMIGMQADASWSDVLRGKVARDEMRRRVEGLHRMLIADRRDATLVSLDAMIQAAQLDHPGELVLVVIDYIQIVEASHATDMRVRVVDVIAQIDDILRHYRCVGLLISQMSRSSSRAARNGEAVGADSTDGGAESAAIERTASVTLSIGASGPQRDDGTCAVDLSIGKSRMFGGDRVIPMSYDGRTGRWRIAGDARSGADVKAERAGQRDSGKKNTALLAMVAHAERADKPQTREELYRAAQGIGGSDIKRAALTEALATGALVEVAVTANRSTARLIWTPAKAASAGIVLARELGR